MNVCKYTFEEYSEIVKTFHGAKAPGVLIGGFMVDLAVRNLPDGALYDAICETKTCLPDAIQLLTPCTIGNGWLKVVHLGLFALTLYQKEGNKGVRVFLDAQKMQTWPEIKTWHFKLKQKHEQDMEKIIHEIKAAGDTVLSLQFVTVKPEIAKKMHKGKIAICPQCRETFPASDGDVCLGCQGGRPYL